jgi:outer membrane protein assembly factor BamB
MWLISTCIMLICVAAAQYGHQAGITSVSSHPGVVLPSTLPGSSDPSGDEWPMSRGALNHTGEAKSMLIPGSDSLWSYSTSGFVYSSPAISGGRVYFGSEDHNLYCLDAVSGAFFWSYATDNSISSSPAIADGRVYFGSSDNKVYCLNAVTGTSIWNYTTGDSVSSSPAVASGRVYVKNYFNLDCLNATTGAFIWTYPIGDSVYSYAISGGRIFFGSYNNMVYCLNAVSGAWIWNYTTGDSVFSSPAVAGDRVYVSSIDRELYCLNATTGACLWNYTTNTWSCDPAISKGRVYIGGRDHKVYCLNAVSGASIWNFTADDWVESSPAIVGNRVYVGSYTTLYCIDATTGQQIEAFSMQVRSDTAITGGRVYIGAGFDLLCIGKEPEHPDYTFIIVIVSISVGLAGVSMLAIILVVVKKRRRLRDERREEMAIQDNKSKIEDALKLRLASVSDTIDMGNRDKLIQELQAIQFEAESNGLKQLAQDIIQQVSKVAKLSHLSHLLQFNNRMKIDEICGILKISRAQFIEMFLDWTKYHRLIIEGEYLVVTKDIDLNKAINDLDILFSQWQNSEKLKRDKL